MMDILGLVWLPDPLVWIAVLVIGLYIYGTWPYSALSKYGYNGPKPQPFFGNVKEVYNTGHLGSWDLTGKRLYGKVFCLYEGRQPTIVVFDTDMLKQCFIKQFNNFIDRRRFPLRGDVISRTLNDARGDDWRRIRNLSSPFFSAAKLKKNTLLLTPCWESLLAKCEKYAVAQQPWDIRKDIGAFTIEAICLMAFGLEIDSQANPDHILVKNLQALTGALDLVFTGYDAGVAFPFIITIMEKLGFDMWPKGTIKTMYELTKLAIEERQKSDQERPDYIQALIKAHVEDVKLNTDDGTGSHYKALSELDIVAQVIQFAVAGYDTIAQATSFFLFNLANNGDCQERLAQEIADVIDGEITYDKLKEMEYLHMCFDESLRLYPPGLRLDRQCANDITINGYFIPKDTLVIIPVYSLHHDPEFWNNPEEFDPERFSMENRPNIDPYCYLPFGIGPRNCIGMRLAQFVVKVAAVKILQKYKITVSKKMKLPLKLEGTLFVRAEGGIHLDLEPR